MNRLEQARERFRGIAYMTEGQSKEEYKNFRMASVDHVLTDLERALLVVEATLEEIRIQEECPLCHLEPLAAYGANHKKGCPLAWWEESA